MLLFQKSKKAPTVKKTVLELAAEMAAQKGDEVNASNWTDEDEDGDKAQEEAAKAADTEPDQKLSRKERLAKEKQVKYEAELASRGPGVGTSSGAAGDQFSLSQQTSKVSSMNLENAVDIKVGLELWNVSFKIYFFNHRIPLILFFENL